MTPPAASERFAGPALLLLTIGVFCRGLSGEFVYDDIPLIVDNPALQSLAAPWAIVSQPLWGDTLGYWRPLTSLLFALGNSLSGATAIHALALLVHLGAVLAGHRLALALTGSGATALVAAGLLALHPVQAESVAWATAINDPLWSLFALLTLGSAHRALRGAGPGWVPCVFLALALFSKENAVVLLPLVALLDLCTRPEAPRRGALYGGLLAVYAGWFAMRAAVFGSIAGGLGEARPDPAYTGTRLLTGPVEILGDSIQLLVVPWPLSPFRTLAPAADPWAVTLAAGWIVVLLAGLAWSLQRRRGITAFGLAAILVILAPSVLAFPATGSRPVQDRYLYLAVFVAGLALAPRTWTRPTLIVAITMLAACATLSAIHVGTFADQRTLIDHGLAHDPDNPTLRAMRGKAALQRYRASGDAADLALAEAEFRLVLGGADSSAAGVRHVARDDARLGLGWCELYRQRYAAAIEHFTSVTRGESAPADAFAGLGIAYASTNDLRAAEMALRRAVELAPRDAALQFNLGRLYGQLGRSDLARQHLEEALRLQPDNAEAARLLRAL